MVRKPGGEKDRNRSEDDQAGRDKAMFPGSGLRLAHCRQFDPMRGRCNS
jgi:hypothetical protein